MFGLEKLTRSSTLWEVNSSRSNREENLSGMNMSGNLTETDDSPILCTNEEVSSYVEEKLKRYGNISWKLEQVSPNHCERKRKNMSPTGEVVIARALKMRKSNSPKTPAPRLRMVREIVNSSGDPIVSIEKKKKRVVKKPKRMLTAGGKQSLITSLFTPKPKRKEIEKESSKSQEEDKRKKEKDGSNGGGGDSF